MANTVSGSLKAGINLTTVFGGGTAGTASEINNLGIDSLDIGPGQAAGRQFTDGWSQLYTNLAAPVTIDLTALVGVGSRAVVLPALRLIYAVNGDPVVGHDVKLGPGASNGLAAPWDDGTAYTLFTGGMPGATFLNGKLIGNFDLRINCVPLGWVIDGTHKTLLIDPGANTCAFFGIALFG